MHGRGKAYWTRLVAELGPSGLRHAASAKKRGVSLSSLRTWLYRLRRERLGQPRILLIGSTQFGSPSAVNQIVQDGFGAGALVDVSVADDGTITGRYSNGQTRGIAQIGLARSGHAWSARIPRPSLG